MKITSMKAFTIHLKSRLLLFALGAVLIVGAGCGNATENETSQGTQGPTAVVLGERDVATVARGTLEEGVTLTGSLEPYLRVDVKAQLSGTLSRLGADRGEAVSQGAILAVIDAEGIRSQAASAEAGVASAKAALALAERQLESARTLYEAGAMSQIEYEQAKTQHEAAQAQVVAAQAAATGAAEQAGRTVVRAPFSGVVSNRLVETGEAVNPGQTLYTIVNTSQLELQGQVPVSQAARLKVGQAVVFTLDAFPGQTYRGTVARIEPTADPGSRQIGVHLRMPNPGGLVGGLFATGRVLSGAAEDVLLVPVAAVRGSTGNEYLFVVENDRVVRRAVTVLGRDTARGVAGVQGTLREGDVVLVSPGTNIEEGMAVRLQGRPPRAANTPDSTEMDASEVQ